MDYRINKQTLLDVLGQWNGFLKRNIHLIACGGTALTLSNIKPVMIFQKTVLVGTLIIF